MSFCRRDRNWFQGVDEAATRSLDGRSVEACPADRALQLRRGTKPESTFLLRWDHRRGMAHKLQIQIAKLVGLPLVPQLYEEQSLRG
jgi:hypothetical protein